MKPDIEPILTMEPDFAASMCLPKARQHQKVPLRLTSTTFSQCSSVTFSAGVSFRAMPALLTRMSIFPCLVTSWSATSATRAESVTSILTPSALKPFAVRPAQPVAAAFGSRSAITTFAPASASASAQASPIPWPAPVTTAVFPFSLNFSRYISCSSCLPPDDLSVLLEAVQADRIRNEPHAIAGFQVEFSDAARREHSEFAGIDIEESIAAQMLGNRDRPGPTFTLFADLQVFGPDAQGGNAVLASRRSGHEVHLGGADEAGDKQVCWPLVQ